MIRLEFMEPFNGTQEIPSPDEQAETSELFRRMIEHILLSFSENVEYTGQSYLGDRAPHTTLYPVMDLSVHSAKVSRVYNRRGYNDYIRLDIPQELSIVSSSTYRLEYWEGVVRRYDVENVEQVRRQAREARQEEDSDYLSNSYASKLLERSLGINDGVVCYNEMLGLHALLLTMLPR